MGWEGAFQTLVFAPLPELLCQRASHIRATSFSDPAPQVWTGSSVLSGKGAVHTLASLGLPIRALGSKRQKASLVALGEGAQGGWKLVTAEGPREGPCDFGGHLGCGLKVKPSVAGHAGHGALCPLPASSPRCRVSAPPHWLLSPLSVLRLLPRPGFLTYSLLQPRTSQCSRQRPCTMLHFLLEKLGPHAHQALCPSFLHHGPCEPLPAVLRCLWLGFAYQLSLLAVLFLHLCCQVFEGPRSEFVVALLMRCVS